MRTHAEVVTREELEDLVREAEFCVGRLPTRIRGVSPELDARRSALYDRLAEVTNALSAGRKIEDV